MPFTHFFPRKNVFPTINQCFPLVYDVIIVLKQSANCVIILTKLCIRSSCRILPLFLEAVPSFLMTTSLLVRQCVCRYINWLYIKLLSVTLLYRSRRVLYNQNKHKDIAIKNQVTFLKQPAFLTAQRQSGQYTPISLQPGHRKTFFCLIQSQQGEVYSHHRHSICSRLKNCTQTARVHQA